MKGKNEEQRIQQKGEILRSFHQAGLGAFTVRVESVGSEGSNRHSRAAVQGIGSGLELGGRWDGGWQDRGGDNREDTAKPGRWWFSSGGEDTQPILHLCHLKAKPVNCGPTL